MVSTKREKFLVVVQLGGGNDYLNTVVPYEDGHYLDNRPNVNVDPQTVLPLEDGLGLNPNMVPIKNLWDEGKVAIINGIGYPNPNRSHFRGMDIWHTCDPEKLATEGWLGRAIRDLDPSAKNVLTGINYGKGLPRALSCQGVPVASVGNLETYGLYPDIEDEWLKKYAVEAFSKMYGVGEGKDPVMDFLGQTGTDALHGADILRSVPEKYSSTVEYAATPMADGMKTVAKVISADLGTRIHYANGPGGFDTHAGQVPIHAKLLQGLSVSIADFMDDMKEQGREDDTLILMFSEFGRRIKDNGSGTDHGSGGVAFLIGGQVKGGMYGEYPSLKEEDQLEGDLHFNNDFRSTYSTVLDRWLGLDPAPIVNGQFEQFDFVPSA